MSAFKSTIRHARYVLGAMAGVFFSAPSAG